MAYKVIIRGFRPKRLKSEVQKNRTLEPLGAATSSSLV